MLRFFVLCSLLLLTACNLNTTPVSVTVTPALTGVSGARDALLVAWVENGSLMAWQTGDSFPRRIATGGVVQPIIAPDGAHIAFTRGTDGTPETLWMVDSAGVAERELVGSESADYTPGIDLIGDVVWLDSGRLLVNTLTAGRPISQAKHDLYAVTISPRRFERLLAAGDGGRLLASPSGGQVILVRPGNYGGTMGTIAIYDVTTRETPRTLLDFPAVATASERPFYPALRWLADESALLAALPSAELIYAENNANVPPTDLWRLPLSGEAQRIGEVRASLFGQPTWSDDGQHLLFLQRGQGDRFTVIEADGNGDNPRTLFGGQAAAISPPVWIDGTQDYVFARQVDDDLRFFIGGIGLDPVRLRAEPIRFVRFVSADDYVYAVQGEGRIELWHGQRDGAGQFIGSAARVPLLDARLLEG